MASTTFRIDGKDESLLVEHRYGASPEDREHEVWLDWIRPHDVSGKMRGTPEVLVQVRAALDWVPPGYETEAK